MYWEYKAGTPNCARIWKEGLIVPHMWLTATLFCFNAIEASLAIDAVLRQCRCLFVSKISQPVRVARRWADVRPVKARLIRVSGVPDLKHAMMSKLLFPVALRLQGGRCVFGLPCLQVIVPRTDTRRS